MLVENPLWDALAAWADALQRQAAEAAAAHTCVMIYDFARCWSRCPVCTRIATDEQLARGATYLIENPEPQSKWRAVDAAQ